MYPEAAVDGSTATIWAPDPAAGGGSLSVDLGARTKLTGATVQWTETLPSTSRIETSLDAKTWTAAPATDQTGRFAHPVQARYLRVTMTSAGGTDRTGIREVLALTGP
jgi:hypothetical protein